MNDERELGRWLDEGSDAPEELRLLLCGGRDALGTSDELLRLQASLARALGPAAGFGENGPMSGTARIGGEPATSGAPRSGGSALKLWLVGGVMATVGGAAVWNVAPWNVEQVSPSAVPAPSSVPAPRVTEATPPTPSELEPGDLVPEKITERALAEPERASRARPKQRAESEAALLQRAQAALATDPARALLLTREHQRRFPQGSLSQEREVIAIEALKRVGAGRAAGEKASEFEQRYRGSVHKERVRESVTSEPVTPPSSKNSAP